MYEDRRITFDEGERYDLLISRAFDPHPGSQLLHDPDLCRIYGRVDKSVWAVVDPIDYEWAAQLKWRYTQSPSGKMYIARNVRLKRGASYVKREGYTLYIPGKIMTMYLHREIMLRQGIEQPSPDHKIVDHGNRNSLDCRRDNLSWQTISFNNSHSYSY